MELPVSLILFDLPTRELYLCVALDIQDGTTALVLPSPLIVRVKPVCLLKRLQGLATYCVKWECTTVYSVKTIGAKGDGMGIHDGGKAEMGKLVIQG